MGGFQRFPDDLGVVRAEADKADLFYVLGMMGKFLQRVNGDARGPFFWEMVHAGGNGREGDAFCAELGRFFHATAVGGGKERVFIVRSAAPYGAHGVDNPGRRQAVAAGGLCVAGGAAVEGTAFRKQLGAGRAVDGSVNPASSKQGFVGSVDNGVSRFPGDVALDDGDAHVRFLFGVPDVFILAQGSGRGYSPPMAKERADELVFRQGLAESREMAKRLIMAAKVAFDEPLPAGAPPRLVDKPGHKLPADARFRLVGVERFVSRGAYKLLTAIEAFNLDVSGMVCLDAGASTGGFTDCLLQHGAARVYAVDVGHAQLHERLRDDPRVISLEGVNLRSAPAELIPEPVDIIVADVSFISLTLVLPPCLRWLKRGGWAAVLVKPQFELGPHQTERGVVRDPALRQAAVDKVLACCRELGLVEVGVVPSSIKGPKGNQEYIACLRMPESL